MYPEIKYIVSENIVTFLIALHLHARFIAALIFKRLV